MHPQRTVGSTFAVYRNRQLIGRVNVSTSGILALTIRGTTIQTTWCQSLGEAIRWAKGMQ